MSPQRWIGLAEVQPRVGVTVLGTRARGAFVSIVAFVRDPQEFRGVSARAFTEYGLQLIKLEDVEPLSTRVARQRVDPILLQDAERIPKDTLFVFGSFHSYPAD